jgi:hypothetical protein
MPSCSLPTATRRSSWRREAPVPDMVRAVLCRADPAERVGTAHPPKVGWRKIKVIGGTSMSTAGVTERIAQASPRFQARMAGVIALITTTAGFAAIVIGNLVVNDNAATTAHNILANEPLYRLAVVGDVVSVLYIVYTLLLYYLFRPVNRSLALLAALFSLVGIAVGMLIPLFDLAALVVLKNAQSLRALNMEQLQALALLFLKLRAQANTISLVLFGTYNIMTGYLIVRSTFLPRILGVLLALAGFCYQINNFANFLAPDFAAHLLPWILIPGAAELLLAAWLLVVGVNVQRWQGQARAASASLRT